MGSILHFQRLLQFTCTMRFWRKANQNSCGGQLLPLYNMGNLAPDGSMEGDWIVLPEFLESEELDHMAYDFLTL